MAADPPFSWYGGKRMLAPAIVDLLPAHRVYVEVFGGSAAVLFAKPRAHQEVYNDVHDGLVTFFRVLRDQPDNLVRALTLTPYARAEHDACRFDWRVDGDDIETARRFYVATLQGYASIPGNSWAFERFGISGSVRSESWANGIDRLHLTAARFRTVQVDRLDWRQVFERYDGETTCFYVDPPYVHETRSDNGGYEHELTDDDHRELVERLCSLRGSVVVSGYEHPLYAPLDDFGYERHAFDSWCRIHGRHIGSKADRRTEVVWRRAAQQDRLFSLATVPFVTAREDRPSPVSGSGSRGVNLPPAAGPRV